MTKNTRSMLLPTFAVLTVLALVGTGSQAASTAEPVAQQGDGLAKAGAAWLDPAWSHRILVTANQSKLDASATLTNFPLVLDGTVLTSAFSRSRADGLDIVVTKADGTTLLPREVVEYQVGTSTAEVWFQADALSTTAYQFYVYYGNSSAAESVQGGVWASDYVAVYHFEENPELGTLKDFTAAGNHARSDQGISNWTASDVGAGRLGQSWHFNGTSHFINTAAVRTQDAGYTVSAWMKHETRGTDFTFQANPGFWHVSSQASDASNNIQFQDFDVQARWGPNPIPLNEFHHFAWVFHPTEGVIEFYFDGVSQEPEFFWPPETDPTNYYAGFPLNPEGTDLVGIMGPIFHNTLDLMNGFGDEFRVSDDEKTGPWIITGFNNQSSPAAFYTVQSEEESTAAAPLSLSQFKSSY